MISRFFKDIYQYIFISQSGFFDKNYYLRTYRDVMMNPLWHFIRFGWKEGKNPSPKFDTNFYLEQYKDVEKANINPLFHYLRYGSKEGRYTNKSSKPKINNANKIRIINASAVRTKKQKDFNINYQEIYNNVNPMRLTDKVDIIICTNQYYDNDILSELLKLIIEKTIYSNYKIHLVIPDDEGKDLHCFDNEKIEIHPYKMKLFNFSMACNLILDASKNDIVLMSERTIITEGWLNKLRDTSKGVAATEASIIKYQEKENKGIRKIGVTYNPLNFLCTYIPFRVHQIVGHLDPEFIDRKSSAIDYSCRSLLNGFPLVISDAIVYLNTKSEQKFQNALLNESKKIFFEKYKLESTCNLSSIKPKVSIIMATRNRPGLIKEAIRSIENINYSNYELIIIDDFSDSNVFSTLVEEQELFSNVILIRLPKHLGMSKARQIGISASSGEFIFFTDDDDLVLPNRISAPLAHILKYPNLDVVYCNYNIVDNTGKIHPIKCQKFDLNSFLNMEFNIGSGILFGRRNVFVEVPFYSAYESAADYDWVFRLLRKGYKIDLCPEIVMNYNRSGAVQLHLSGTKESFDKHKEIYERELLIKKMTKN